MLDAARQAMTFASGRSEADLGDDELLLRALERCIEIVGEAASRVSPELRAAHEEIAWTEIIGMRHKVIHDYSFVDSAILWDTVTLDLPPLLESLAKLVDELSSA